MSRKSPASQPGRFPLNQGHYFLFFLLFLSMFACYKLLQPYIHPIILAILLATLVQPIHHEIENWLGRRKNVAAFASCTLLTILVVLPLMILLVVLIQQGIQIFDAIYAWIISGEYKKLVESSAVIKVTGLLDEHLPSVQKIFPDFNLESLQLDKMLLQLSSSTGKMLLNQGGHLFGNLSALVGKFFLMLFTFFFVVRDYDKMLQSLLHLIPLSSSHERQIIAKVKSVAQSAMLGTLVTAAAQGIAGGIGFGIANLPGFFWGTVMAFASLIPVVGTALIWVPAATYLFLSGHWGYGLFLVVWCVLIVGLIDNFVRPLFMKGSGETMSTVLIFFSILGGLHYFGLIGLLYGPLIFGLMAVFLYIYSLEFKTFLKQQDRS